MILCGDAVTLERAWTGMDMLGVVEKGSFWCIWIPDACSCLGELLQGVQFPAQRILFASHHDLLFFFLCYLCSASR